MRRDRDDSARRGRGVAERGRRGRDRALRAPAGPIGWAHGEDRRRLDVTGPRQRSHGRPRAAGGHRRRRHRGMRSREPSAARGAVRLQGAPGLGRRRPRCDPREPDRRGRRRPAVADRPACARGRGALRDHDGLRPLPEDGRAPRRAARGARRQARDARAGRRGRRGRGRRRDRAPLVPESKLTKTEWGLLPTDKGWFVVNARKSFWLERGDRGALTRFEGFEQATDFDQLGINLQVLGPGEPMSMYHWEADQEDFLILSGEALAIVEGEERAMMAWDLLHCPAHTKHVIIGAGDGCVVLAVGARDKSVDNPDSGGYSVDETALKRNAGVEKETNDPDEAYARFEETKPTRYRDGWLP